MKIAIFFLLLALARCGKDLTNGETCTAEAGDSCRCAVKVPRKVDDSPNLEDKSENPDRDAKIDAMHEEYAPCAGGMTCFHGFKGPDCITVISHGQVCDKSYGCHCPIANTKVHGSTAKCEEGETCHSTATTGACIQTILPEERCEKGLCKTKEDETQLIRKGAALIKWEEKWVVGYALTSGGLGCPENEKCVCVTKLKNSSEVARKVIAPGNACEADFEELKEAQMIIELNERCPTGALQPCRCNGAYDDIFQTNFDSIEVDAGNYCIRGNGVDTLIQVSKVVGVEEGKNECDDEAGCVCSVPPTDEYPERVAAAFKGWKCHLVLQKVVAVEAPLEEGDYCFQEAGCACHKEEGKTGADNFDYCPIAGQCRLFADTKQRRCVVMTEKDSFECLRKACPCMVSDSLAYVCNQHTYCYPQGFADEYCIQNYIVEENRCEGEGSHHCTCIVEFTPYKIGVEDCSEDQLCFREDDDQAHCNYEKPKPGDYVFANNEEEEYQNRARTRVRVGRGVLLV